MQGFLNPFMIIGTEKLGNQNGGTAAETDKEAVQQTDEGTGGTDGSQSLSSDEPAHNDGIHSVVHLLEEGTQQNREEKGKQLFPDNAFGNIPGGGVRGHPVHLLGESYLDISTKRQGCL